MLKAFVLFGVACACALDDISALQYAKDVQADEPSMNVRRVAAKARVRNVERGVTRKDRVAVSMHNNEDMDYTATIHIGGQPLRCIMDTGSFELVIFTNRCQAAECKANVHMYKPDDSETMAELGWQKQLSYGSGDVQASLMEDSVDFGIGNSSLAFWGVVNAQLPILQQATFECIFGISHPKEPLMELKQAMVMDQKMAGLCPQSPNPEQCQQESNERIAHDKDFFQTMQQKQTPIEDHSVQRFSICFQKESGSNGYLFWNDHPPSGHFAKVEVTGHMHWSAPISNLKLDGVGQPICSDGQCSCLLDSGTSLVAVPTQFLQTVVQNLNLNYKSCDDIVKYPALKFTLGGQEFELPPDTYLGVAEEPVPNHLKSYFPDHLHSEYAAKQGTKSRCMLMMMNIDIQSYSGLPQMIMGMPIFRHYYTTFEFWGAEQENTYANRSMYLAPATGDCSHPSTASKAQMIKRSGPQKARKVNWSKIRVPQWLEHAKKTGRTPF